MAALTHPVAHRTDVCPLVPPERDQRGDFYLFFFLGGVVPPASGSVVLQRDGPPQNTGGCDFGIPRTWVRVPVLSFANPTNSVSSGPRFPHL